jgi:hypothetical protein
MIINTTLARLGSGRSCIREAYLRSQNMLPTLIAMPFDVISFPKEIVSPSEGIWSSTHWFNHWQGSPSRLPMALPSVHHSQVNS